MLKRTLLPIVFLFLGWGFWVSPSFQDLAAGVALFLFGMLCMDQGFKALSGGALQSLLKRSTDSRWKSLGFGFASTALMQSSSLVTLLTISFLSAGLIPLAAGIGIIFGSNLGTTTGAWLVATFGMKVNLSTYAIPVMVFGVVLLMQASPRQKGLGWILAGIGFLFLGIDFMKEGFASFSGDIDLSQYSMEGIPGLLVYTLVGVIATVVMQSSHATLTLTIAALATGQVSYANALALAIGANVGTTVTAAIGALGASAGGRRLAAAHFAFNLTTGLVALLLIVPLQWLVDTLASAMGIAADNYTLKLALFHTLFNLMGVLIMLPLTERLVNWLEARIRDPRPSRDGPRFLSSASLEMPQVALQALTLETRHLLDNTFSILAHAVSLRRADVTSDEALQAIVSRSREVIAIDIDKQYENSIKDIYSANVAFVSKAQDRAPQQAEAWHQLRRANLHAVAALKSVKHLQKNMNIAIVSRNTDLQACYDSFRERIAAVLRLLGKLEKSEDMEETYAALKALKKEHEDADEHLAMEIDKLIREDRITSQMASSLINDGRYVRQVCRKLLSLGRDLVKAADLEESVELEAISAGPEEATEPA